MSSLKAELPPIKKYRIDQDKALDRVHENISHYHDTGATSRVYVIANTNEV
jgi:hypothetical protein